MKSFLPPLESGVTGFTREDGTFQATGSQMGRRKRIPDDANTFPAKMRLVRLKWFDGDYDVGGAYWGYVRGTSIYRAYGDCSEESAEIFVRCKSRQEAKLEVLKLIPNARFYR